MKAYFPYLDKISCERGRGVGQAGSRKVRLKEVRVENRRQSRKGKGQPGSGKNIFLLKLRVKQEQSRRGKGKKCKN